MYKWDIHEIDNILRTYQAKAKEASNPDLKKQYNDICANILDLVDFYTDFIGEDQTHANYDYVAPVSIYSIILDDLKILKEYGIYAPIVRDFLQKFQGSVIAPVAQLPRIKTSANGIVTMTTSFYQQFKGVFSDTYNQLASHFRTRLYFKKMSHSYDVGGNTHQIYHTDIIFTDVGKANSFQDYISHIHESSHGITCLLNQDIMWDFGKYGFIEVDALFFELLGTDYVSAQLGRDDDALRLKQATFKDYLYSADLVCSKMDLYNTLSPSQLKNNRLVRQFYKREIGYDKTGISDACHTYIHEVLHYIVSYLTAIELYLIYRNSPAKALRLLQQIIMLKGLSPKVYLERIHALGIQPGEHIQDYYQEIFKTKGKSENGKKLQHRN